MSQLAAWYYRSVVNPESGPISRLVVDKVVQEGQPQWQALAYLHASLRQTDPKNPGHVAEVYGRADGTGTAKSKSAACHKAISEALERWAWMAALTDGALRKTCGLDVDNSTTGFAAWPGPFAKHARARAYYEAAERWTVAAWWDGMVAHELVSSAGGVDTLELKTPIVGVAVALLHSATMHGDHAYGFAAGGNFSEAAARAVVELARNVAVLERRNAKASVGPLPEPQGLYERRLLFFASREGHGKFAARLVTRHSGQMNHRRIQVDTAVPGPWNKYCRVWRVLFRPVSVETRELERFLF